MVYRSPTTPPNARRAHCSQTNPEDSAGPLRKTNTGMTTSRERIQHPASVTAWNESRAITGCQLIQVSVVGGKTWWIAKLPFNSELQGRHSRHGRKYAILMVKAYGSLQKHLAFGMTCREYHRSLFGTLCSYFRLTYSFALLSESKWRVTARHLSVGKDSLATMGLTKTASHLAACVY